MFMYTPEKCCWKKNKTHTETFLLLIRCGFNEIHLNTYTHTNPKLNTKHIFFSYFFTWKSKMNNIQKKKTEKTVVFFFFDTFKDRREKRNNYNYLWTHTQCCFCFINLEYRAISHKKQTPNANKIANFYRKLFVFGNFVRLLFVVWTNQFPI